jgi:two-component system, OmpR family, alkaline phosphatase synthesis response regulator PhoP
MQAIKVLLIDDEANLLVGLKAVMTRAGYEVVTAGSGADGLRLAQEAHPDIIISDVMMPPPNGFELRRQLALNPKTATIPFIFLTARTAQVDKLHGLEAGADDYITKPFDRQELLIKVNNVLRRQEIGRRKGLHQI